MRKLSWFLVVWCSWRSRIWHARMNYARDMYDWHQETSLAARDRLMEKRAA